MEFTYAMDTSELPDGTMTSKMVNGKEILIANVGERYYAMKNKCTHLGGALANGTLEGTIVTCPSHGAKFDITSGEPCGNAKVAFLQIKVHPEECYQVKVEGNFISICVD